MDSENTIKRREFLGHSSAAALVGVASLNGMANELLAGNGQGERLECTDFEGLVGETFTVSDQPASLKLIDAQRAKHATDSRPSHVRQEPFSLVFTAPEGTELDDAIHRVEHRGVGRVDVYINRIQMESHPHGNTYEIVFS